MTTLQYIGLLGAVWGLGVFALNRRLPLALSLDIASVAMLVYLMVASAMNGEYSVMNLV